eukprot:364418-Chlamydomonas_euryale.AAC.9
MLSAPELGRPAALLPSALIPAPRRARGSRRVWPLRLAATHSAWLVGCTHGATEAQAATLCTVPSSGVQEQMTLYAAPGYCLAAPTLRCCVLSCVGATNACAWCDLARGVARVASALNWVCAHSHLHCAFPSSIDLSWQICLCFTLFDPTFGSAVAPCALRTRSTPSLPFARLAGATGAS